MILSLPCSSVFFSFFSLSIIKVTRSPITLIAVSIVINDSFTKVLIIVIFFSSFYLSLKALRLLSDKSELFCFILYLTNTISLFSMLVQLELFALDYNEEIMVRVFIYL